MDSHGHEARTWACGLDMDTLHGQGIDMQNGHVAGPIEYAHEHAELTLI
jgi:hypothetical protein